MKNKNIIKYFNVSNLKQKQIQYGFFTRQGGCSENNFQSLNCSFNAGDKIGKVKNNIKIAKNILNLKQKKIKFLNQIHSTKIEIISKKNFSKIINADGCITLSRDICLALLTADCAPIFLFDSKYSFICALHAGWRGCLNNIISCAIKKIKTLNNNNNEITAIIGPCLDQNNFEVDKNFKNIFLKKNKLYEKFFHKKGKINKLFFDMRGLINYQLITMSISNIYNINHDTYANHDLFFSHRRTTQKNLQPTGRMINIIGFKP